MKFEWDLAKRQRNLNKHGIDFLTARRIFEKPHTVVSSNREGEPRFLATGRVGTDIISVAYPERDTNIRIISARMARTDERKKYRDIYE